MKRRVDKADPLLAESAALAALLGAREETEEHRVPVEQLVPNHYNPRQQYDPVSLQELADSMREHGFLGALDGRRLDDGRVEVAYGSRRLLAAREANLSHIPVHIHDFDDAQMLTVALVENVQRDDLTPLEEAQVIGQMHSELGWSVRTIAQKTAKPVTWVQDVLALYRAPSDVKDIVRERPDALRHARFISRLPDESDRRVLGDAVLEHQLRARDMPALVREVESGKPAHEALDEVIVARAAQAEQRRTPVAPSQSPTEPVSAAPSVSPAEPSVEEAKPTEAAQPTPPPLPDADVYDPRPDLRIVLQQLKTIAPDQLGTVDEHVHSDIRALLDEIASCVQHLAQQLKP